MSTPDWYAWHAPYDDPTSRLSRRLHAVQQRIRDALDRANPGPITAVSLCAGQGHDLLGVLATHPRGSDVRATLVELDHRNVVRARQAATAAGHASRISVIEGDAADPHHYPTAIPADLVLACGIFGNIGDEDIEHTIGRLAELCAPGGTVIWTRHRRPPDLVPQICAWFGQHRFELGWLSDPDQPFGVGVHRFTGAARPLDLGQRLFTFVEADAVGELGQRALAVGREVRGRNAAGGERADQ